MARDFATHNFYLIMEKTLHNTTADGAKKNVSDLVIWGNGDMFKLLCKASSKKEGWMKSTKAMEIEGVGCVVQVTTQQKQEVGFSPHKKDEAGKLELLNEMSQLDMTREASQYVVAEAVTFVPGVKIEETEEDGNVVSRKLVAL